ncbi:MAG: phage major capsid protein [Clostridia bacterium]|nr:phage major capsid protein [Clostridia bacterium]
MLTRLRLEFNLKQKRTALAALLERKSGYEERSRALRTALEEAQTTEDTELINTQLTELENEIGGTDFAAEEATLNGEINDIENELKELDEKETAAATPPAPAAVDSATTTTERKAGYSHMKRRGIFYSLPVEQRNAIIAKPEVRSFLDGIREAVQTRAVSGMQHNVPVDVLGLVKEQIGEYSKLLKHVNVVPVSGDAKVPIMGIAPEGIWTDATSKLNERSLAFYQIEVGNYKVSGYVAIYNSDIEDNDEATLSNVIEALGKGIGKAIDRAIIYGTGNNMPLGIVTRLAQAAKPASWSAKAPEWKDLHETHIIKKDLTSASGSKFFEGITSAAGVPSSEYSTDGMFWAMSHTTAMEIKGKAIAFNASAVLQSNVANEMPVIGGAIEELDFIPDGDIVFGYGSLYTMAERKSITLGSSEHVLYLDDQTVFAGKARYDGAPVIGEGFGVMNIHNKDVATTSTFAAVAAN